MVAGTRLVLVLIALVVVALGATDAITYTSLRSYLFQQVDTTLTSISTVSNGPGQEGQVERALFNTFGNGELGLPNGTFAALYDTDTAEPSINSSRRPPSWTGCPGRPASRRLEQSLSDQGHRS